jgi:retron-type reverse transcriptase
MDIYESLSEILLIDEHELIDYIRRAPYKYKVYQIPKRNNRGKRTIAQPARELKVFQKIALDHSLLKLPIHDAAFAYRDGVGIKQNAERHSKNQFLLKMDFENFFPSILDQNLIDHIKKHHKKLSERDSVAIKNLFFWRMKGETQSRLSIGAPSSPFISNTLLFEFDEVISSICDSMDVTYTRYADDLTFTTNQPNILSKIPSIVESTLASISTPRLIINHQKTVFSSKKSNRHVTGLVISNDDKVSLGRKRKRYIRSLVFKFDKKELSSEESLHLKGLIGFSKNIEPSFHLSLVKKYTHDLIRKIEKFDVVSDD